MENRNTQRQETSSEQAKRENGGVRIGIIAITFSVICLTMFSCASTSRPSTPAEISSQMKLQEEWNIAHKEAEQRWDSTLKAEQNRDLLENNNIKSFKKP